MRLIKIKTVGDINGIRDIDIDFSKVSETFNLVVGKEFEDYYISPIIPDEITKILKGLRDNTLYKSSNGSLGIEDIAAITITFECDGKIVTYTQTISENVITLETLYEDGELYMFLNRLEWNDNYINPKADEKIKKIFSAMCTYPTLMCCEPRLLKLSKYLDVKEIYNKQIYDVSDTAKDIVEKILINSDLGIKRVDSNFCNVITTGGYSISKVNMGSGVKKIMDYFPYIIDTIIKGNLCIINEDIFSVFHPHLMKSIVNLFKSLVEKYNSQMFILWYGNNEGYLLSCGDIEKENIIFPIREGKSLIYDKRSS